MRVVVAGDRFWPCYQLAGNILRRLTARYGPDIVIVHGGGPGVDEAFAQAARGLGISADFHPVDFGHLGDYRFRHREMLRPGAGLCVIVHRLPLDAATQDLVEQALTAGVPTYLIEDDQGLPRRLKEGDERLG